MTKTKPICTPGGRDSSYYTTTTIADIVKAALALKISNKQKEINRR
jgi:hypothetical protein